MKKILTVIGARPQFIKAAVVSRSIKKNGTIKEVIVHTGQHFDYNMSEVFFNEMDIPLPDYNLNINSLGHGAMTGSMMQGIEEILLSEKPDMVMVYGDTNSTLAGALTAVKLQIPVSHVEAGLRSFNLSMPEEVNRILTDRISSLLFCPTDTSIGNLEKEGFRHFKSTIHLTGDVMYDAALYYSDFSETKSEIISALNLSGKAFLLCTLHRQENIKNEVNLRSIITALNRIKDSCRIILPIHPGTRKLLEINNIKPDFELLDPVGYFDMIELLKNCKLVITDSGGLQKEAYFFKKYCITMREETEWTELVDGGHNVLTGADKAKMLRACDDLIEKEFNGSFQYYGNGKAGEIIVEHLVNYLR